MSTDDLKSGLHFPGQLRSSYSASSLLQNQQAYSRDGRVRAARSACGT
jgi:hypothetical protein